MRLKNSKPPGVKNTKEEELKSPEKAEQFDDNMVNVVLSPENVDHNDGDASAIQSVPFD